MTDSSGPVLRRLTREKDHAALLEVDQWAFAFDDSEVDPEPALEVLTWERTYGAYLSVPGHSEPRLAGVYSSYPLELSVPGGGRRAAPAPCAGLTWVGVHPQFRRRGVLTAMMRHHLDDVRDRGEEPLSALYAAEPAIYGRFGYGLATYDVGLTLGRGVALRDVPGTDRLALRLEKADPDRHAALVEACRNAARRSRPGDVSRPGLGHQRIPLVDQLPWRRGSESLRIAIVEVVATGEVRAYALFRRKADWEDGGPNGTVTVREATTLDAAAARVLWGRLCDFDLMARLTTDSRPVDDPLLHLLVDVRAAKARLADGVWLRLLDVPAALARRRYAADVDVVLEVSDALLPDNAGRWRLTGGPDKAACERTDAAADLTLDVRELGAAYLGGVSLTALATAGLVSARSEAVLLHAATAFGSPVAPACGFMF